jgi:hypothetical protein
MIYPMIYRVGESCPRQLVNRVERRLKREKI